MRSTKCPTCGLVQWAESDICKRCGAQFGSGGAVSQQSFPAEQTFQPHQPYANSYASEAQLKQGLAIASMVMAIIAFPTTFLLIGLLLAPIAVIMGIVALRRATKNPMTYGGKGFAVAGIAVGSVVCVFFVPLIAAIAIPNLLASRRAANEGSALDSLEIIALAQDKHSSNDVAGDCGDLMMLAAKNMIVDAKVASGKKNGYKFTAGGNQSDTDGCEVRATPESKSAGNRSFYFSSSDNIVRVAMNGEPANRTDPPGTSTVASSR